MNIDAITGRLHNKTSLRRWLLEHDMELQQWADEIGLDPQGQEAEFEFLLDNPDIAYAVLDDFTTSDQEKRKAYLDWFFSSSKLLLMVGKRGSGKTSFGLWTMEEAHRRGLITQAVHVKGQVPSWLQVIDNIKQAQDGAKVFYDEMQLSVPGRRATSKENVDLQDALSVSRHKDVSILGGTQHHKLIDINMVRFSDAFLFKSMTFQELTEYEDRTMKRLMEFIRRIQPSGPNEALFADPPTFYKFTVPQPSFWSDLVSKSYKSLSPIEAVNYCLKLKDKGYSIKAILRELGLRGRSDWSEYDVKMTVNPKYAAGRKKDLLEIEKMKKR